MTTRIFPFTRYLIFAALLLPLLFSNNVSAQYVTIPDANFASYLNQRISACMNGNQLDTTCSSLSTFTTLYISNLGIQDLTGVQYFTNLNKLTCHLNPLTTLPVLPLNLEILEAQQCSITTIPANLPASLRSMRLDHNSIASLPVLPAGLEVLFLRSNSMTAIPANLPTNLKELYVFNNAIPSITNPLPPNLEWLGVAGNSSNFTFNGVSLPSSLLNLDLRDNGMTSIPALPANLKGLWVANNQLTTLPPLPASLTDLDLLQNYNLVPPATLPPSLERLEMSYINTNSLPPLPSPLITLGCRGLSLTSIPTLPPNLQLFWAEGNNLTSLPPLPTTLLDLNCRSNQLTSLPAPLPNMHSLRVDNNQIACFPEFPTSITALNINSNPFTCLPNYIPVMSAGLINTYPLCVLGDPVNNPNNCANGIGINGLTYEDNNANCTSNTGEPGVQYVPIHLSDVNNNRIETTFSTSTGGYYFSPQPGTYTTEMDLSQAPFLQAVCPAGTTSTVTTTTLAPVQSGVDFDVECAGFDTGVQSAATSGWIFPGQVHSLRVRAGDLSQFNGLNCAAGVSGQVQIDVTGPVSYQGPANGSLTPTVNGTTYSYTISDFATVNLHSDFVLQFSTDTIAQTGDTICVTVTVTPPSGDLDPSNNTYQHCYFVANSYDPNNKEVWPQQVAPGYTGWLNYTIHFQNVGSAPAFNIRLIDSLDANLDWTTFRVSGFSHANSTTVNASGLVVAKFPNIMLPDSVSDPAGSQGYLQFKIKPKPSLPMSQVIPNEAYIYFDFNAPILTNTAEVSFDGTVSREQDFRLSGVQVSPNPGTGWFHLNWNPAHSQEMHIAVHNLAGKQVASRVQNGTNTADLDLRQEPAGIYLVTFRQGSQFATRKLVKRN